MSRHLEPVVAVPEALLRRGRFYSRFWIAGWVVGLVSAGFCGGMAVSYDRSMKRVSEANREIREVHDELAVTTAALAKAWEDQRSSIRLIVSWAEYVKEREDLSKQNRENAPTRLPIVRAK